METITERLAASSEPGGSRGRWWLLAAVLAFVAASSIGCTSDSSGNGGEGESSATEQTGEAADTVAYEGRSAETVTGPIEGDTIVFPQPAAPAPDGYTTEEFFIGGTASSFDAAETPADGMWEAEPDDEAEYLTRAIVHRPPAEEFSGTVLVEWLNVSALEASPDWAYLSEEVGREGHAYVLVSTQAQGIEGGETLLDAAIDEEAAAAAGAEDSGGATDNSGLKNTDPDRYGTLSHPGDAYAYDIFSQVGRAITEDPALLGGLEAEQVIGVGESQSAFFLTTYANAIHPIDPVYDGLIIHSRGAGASPLSGLREVETDENGDRIIEEGVLIRTDLDIPVFMLLAETDLTMLGYANARQPDTDMIRTWEVAGTAHADAHQIRALVGGPRDPMVGSVLGCTEPFNIGPHHEVYQAGLNHFVSWVGGGEAPPESPRLEMADGDELEIVRDENMIALGGIRTPLVDVPVNAPIGDPPAALADEGIALCTLFGTTIPFDQPKIVELHGTADDYIAAFAASAAEAVEAGFLLQSDADALIAEAEENRALFG
ncbi:MAG: hypothetical protein GY812_14735 [Actinomycetia bacterium]|nr:hypothetical protein [Actinomycetes bacterium]